VEIVESELLNGKYNHDKPLFARDLKEFLPIVEDFPQDLMNIFKEATYTKPNNGIASMLGL